MQRILLTAVASTLLVARLTCFAGEEIRAAAVSGFNPADYKVCGVTIVKKTTDAQARGFAIIEYLKTGKQDMYQPGDTLSGARITGIDKDSVTLEEKKHILHVETAVQATTTTAVEPKRSLTPVIKPPGVIQQTPYPVYRPPQPVVPEPTVEEFLKNIEQEQSEQKR